MSDRDDIIKAEADICCASCGIAEVDDVKLTECDGCDLVRYCSDTCQEDHRSEHEVKCEKRAAELRDELLFSQPESSHIGDCPICCLPMPLDDYKSMIYTCCSKTICVGCSFANDMYENSKRTCHLHVHFVETLHQKPMKSPSRI